MTFGEFLLFGMRLLFLAFLLAVAWRFSWRLWRRWSRQKP